MKTMANLSDSQAGLFLEEGQGGLGDPLLFFCDPPILPLVQNQKAGVVARPSALHSQLLKPYFMTIIP